MPLHRRGAAVARTWPKSDGLLSCPASRVFAVSARRAVRSRRPAGGPHFGWQATTASACTPTTTRRGPGRDWPPDQGRHRPGPRQRQRGGRARRPSVEPRGGGGAKRRRSSHTPSVELVETTAPPHRRLDPLTPIRAFALRVERLATSQHVDVLLDPPGSGLRPLGGTETVQHGKAVLAGEILEHRLRLRPRG